MSEDVKKEVKTEVVDQEINMVEVFDKLIEDNKNAKVAADAVIQVTEALKKFFVDNKITCYQKVEKPIEEKPEK